MTTSSQEARKASDPKWFRQVLGQFPTGVCVITAAPPGAPLAGMVVGSFTSVSLDPPLVAFLPDRTSSSWPKIEAAGRFCVNILGADQEALCRRFAAKAGDKFEGVAWRPAPTGSPILADSVAWIDCEIGSVLEAGDHYIVIGEVGELQINTGGLPMLFFQGGYGKFSPLSMVAPDPLGAIAEPLRQVDMLRAEMEELAAELDARCIATARVDDEIVIIAGAGSARRDSIPTLVGQRLPNMPPTASVFGAWCGDAEIARWLDASIPAAARPRALTALRLVRERGYSVGLVNDAQRAFISTLAQLAGAGTAGPDTELRELIPRLSFDPEHLLPAVQNDIRLISVPVFGPRGNVALALTLHDFPKPAEGVGIQSYIDRMLAMAGRATRKIGGFPKESSS
ncbi:flavin reductase [Pseudoduganella namucuonensis]|uniref:NADH-FMN oxidoreductase RutF, flavin reductase (DIM6/NTAB) family n=1 Tax=Pseudoduganella namucuonensis TaxID=1035707 RepID=A0A1I7KZ37_9BURK|nr:flavin reductase [Pseudoduganella namucuonensis]SFV02648.1 NADH-FMN oxidoreductase RutF, flavin reductase (DIM6/NTAB) family [Pseudoduganella namucuonensis]